MNVKSVVSSLGTSFAMSICAAQSMEPEDKSIESSISSHAFDFKDVSDNVAIELFYHADVQSLGRCAQVCQRWESIVNDDWIWKKAAENYTKTRSIFGFIKTATTIVSVDKCKTNNIPIKFETDTWKTIVRNHITYLKELCEMRKTFQPIMQFEYHSFEDVVKVKDQYKKEQVKVGELGRDLTIGELILLKYPAFAESLKNIPIPPELQASGISTPEQIMEMLGKGFANAYKGASEGSSEEFSDEGSSEEGCTIQ